MKLKYIIYLLIAIAMAYFVYYRISANQKIAGSGGGKDKKGPPPSLNVNGIVVSTGNFINDLGITGAIEANESIALQSEVSGLITGIYFKEGSNVNKGALLLKINDRDIQAQLQQARTKEKLSSTNEDRAKQLLQKGAISQEEYDTSLADLLSLRAQTQLIRAQLAKTSIYAPFSGKIGLRSVSTGEYITPSKVIANLMSINPIKIRFSVPEKYAGQIQVDSPISFKTSSSSKVYTGKVFAIEPGINTQTRTLQLRAVAPNPNMELLPGAFATIELSLNTLQDAILIPNEAIIPVLKGKTVYISKNGKAVQVPVQASTRTAENIVITSGLKVGDTVLTTGAMALKPDAAVKVTIVKN